MWTLFNYYVAICVVAFATNELVPGLPKLSCKLQLLILRVQLVCFNPEMVCQKNDLKINKSVPKLDL
jgi:hypothetical protein